MTFSHSRAASESRVSTGVSSRTGRPASCMLSAIRFSRPLSSFEVLLSNSTDAFVNSSLYDTADLDSCPAQSAAGKSVIQAEKIHVLNAGLLTDAIVGAASLFLARGLFLSRCRHALLLFGSR